MVYFIVKKKPTARLRHSLVLRIISWRALVLAVAIGPSQKLEKLSVVAQ
jgi:hypothetical protein